MTLPTTGWGAGAWGGSAWGGALPGGIFVLSVLAVSENVIRVTFNESVYFSNLLDPPDSSNPDTWQVTPVAGSIGYDGNPARAAMVVTVTQPTGLVGELLGESLDLTLDRPMTPFPAVYDVTTTANIFSSDLSQVMVPADLGTTPALFRVLNPQDPTVTAPGRDIANPQTYNAALQSTIAQPQIAVLGSFGYGPDGDYAIDSKDTGLLKRLQRRLFTKENGFVHLPGYGVGVLTYGKALGRMSTRQQLAADCEAQFSREPEVAQCNVLSRLDPTNPNLVRLAVYIKKKSGKTSKYGMLIALQ